MMRLLTGASHISLVLIQPCLTWCMPFHSTHLAFQLHPIAGADSERQSAAFITPSTISTS